MNELINLGNLYVSDFITSPNDYEGRERYPLTLTMDETLHAPRLTHAVDPDQMYGRYWYHSGTNEAMRRALKDIVDEIESRIEFSKGDIWLDIACNDGTLLNMADEKFTRIGIDPIEYGETSISKIASDSFGIRVQDYFSAGAFSKLWIGEQKCKVITTVAMLYDLDDPVPFVQDVRSILADDGVWVVQMSYTPLMIEQTAFDNICHEHIYYYGLRSLKRLVEPLGFVVVDCSLNDTNGGSFRVYLMKSDGDLSAFGTAQVRDVCRYRVQTVGDYETMQETNCPPKLTWGQFRKRVEKMKAETVGFIRDVNAQGKTVYAYGASTKGNTLLQYFGLNSDDITAIAERAPAKYGLYTVGSNIPILPEDEVRKANPDYILVLPWHFIGAFCEREKEYLNGGGKFIVPCPQFEVIGK